jgi:hypothetical protein
LLLEGVAPLRHSLEDVATPVLDGGPDKGMDIEPRGLDDFAATVANNADCDCTAEGPDGYTDLVLKYQKSEIVATLGAVSAGDVIPLTLTGQLNDGTLFEATDCVMIIGGNADPQDFQESDELVMASAVPNPFNPSTKISFTVPKRVRATLAVYDVEGKLVTTLVNESLDAGLKEVTWHGKDARGNPVSTGVYFYRLTAGNRTLTKKMVLLK